MATKVTRSPVVIAFLPNKNLSPTTLAIPVLVVRMLSATMEFALVSPNIKEILTLVVDLNAFSTRTVQETKPAYEANALIRALSKLAHKMPSAKLCLIFRCADVRQDSKAMH